MTTACLFSQTHCIKQKRCGCNLDHYQTEIVSNRLPDKFTLFMFTLNNLHSSWMHYYICVGNKLHYEVFWKTNMTSTSVRLFRAFRENCVRAKTTCRNALISNNYNAKEILSWLLAPKKIVSIVLEYFGMIILVISLFVC